MKKSYESAQFEVVLFDQAEVIVASGNSGAGTTYSRDNDETEIL